MIKLALIVLLLFQSQVAPQTSVGFGAALAHAHPAGARFDVTGVFCGHKLVADPANTTGHNFYGNAVCVNPGAGPRWYWYDWPADPSASVKIAKWSSSGVTITLQVADPNCLLALSAVEGKPTVVTQVSGGGVYGGSATLTATLTSGGAPLVGKPVSFTLNGGAPGWTAVTNASGVATVPNVSISGINAGAYPGAVGATFVGDTAYIGSVGAGALNVSKANQTITFASVTDKTFGAPDFNLNATASSGLGVSFLAKGACTVSGATVHITGAGSCTVTASQAGDSNFGPAPDVARSFQIAKAATATSVASSASPAAHGQPVTFTATVTSAAGSPTGAVQFKVDGSNVGSPQALDAAGVASLSTAGLSAGPHVVTAVYGGDVNFAPSAGTLAGGQSVGGVFEFAQALFTVNERDGSVAVTVRRRGDASQAATVEYATDDGSIASVPVPCSSATGSALERCDYTRAQGLLQFAPGEAEKTFSVLVNGDSYLEGPETTRVRLSNPTVGTVLSETPSAAIEIADDTQQTSNPLAGSEFFVRQHYHDFLNREPDAPGLAFWTNDIEQCGTDAVCREVKRINVSAAFFLSIEFQQTGYLVYRTYKAAYGDATSPNVEGTVPAVRLQEFLPDTRRIGEGVVVGAPNWEQKLDANKDAFLAEFVQRPRFLAEYPLTMPSGEYVQKLTRNAGITLTGAEQERVAGLIRLGPELAARAEVLRLVAESESLRQNEFNRAFVLMQYYGYLRRNPDDPQDTDFRGWKFWLDKLNEFNGNFVQAEMVKAFISSDEYRRRFGQ